MAPRGFTRRSFAVRLKVVLHADDDNETVVREAFTVQRGALAPETLGLQLEETKDLYRTNAALYPTWQQSLRERQPLTLIFWGQGDIFFTPAGGEAYLRDLPDAELVRLNSGHFAVEDNLQQIAE